MRSIIFLLILVLLSAISAEKTCKMLVLKGGDDHGAWQAGVLVGIFNNSIPADIEYDIISGISAGGLNTIGLSQYPKGQERNSGQNAWKLWDSIDQADIFAKWKPAGFLQGLFFEKGLLNTTILNVTLHKLFIGVPQRPIQVGITNIDTMEFTFLDNNSMKDFDLTIKSGICTSAIECFLPYQKINGFHCGDGGLTKREPFESVIKWCQDQGFDEKDMIIDAVMPSWLSQIEKNVTGFTSIAMIERVFKLYMYDNRNRDLIAITRDYPQINFRYFVFPSHKFPEMGLQFSHVQLHEYLLEGYQDGVNALKQGKDKFINDLQNIGRPKAKQMW